MASKGLTCLQVMNLFPNFLSSYNKCCIIFSSHCSGFVTYIVLKLKILSGSLITCLATTRLDCQQDVFHVNWPGGNIKQLATALSICVRYQSGGYKKVYS